MEAFEEGAGTGVRKEQRGRRWKDPLLPVDELMPVTDPHQDP